MTEAVAVADDVVPLFKGAMRRLASAVGVVTAEGPDGVTGMAATSITSLTMDPPAVLVCVNRSASLHACLSQGCAFNINILSRHQRDISSAFGGAVARELRFTVGAWTPDHRGLAMLDDAQANLSCVVDAIWPYGTHSIVVGRVEAVRLTGEVAPLIYQDGTYL
ncbi:flavin reductase family protein [Sphingomonas jatrophae]|uniref:NADH-FMN oxidoreductase RutF, flavin reductase (DIM6/NTAB) family n=1 Tax=Sphingomonas jatrophae TaxID=1166337 RepID=A0A1I6KLP6_9SPHN|nr:flavin reductase family protein [Sphingomonas jatrophae]SFR92183.1 NADH-FMN oxidoreductase RutF, flavin reductase (DIM6/NTAB) family [Sphingomonas jatrophae]